MRTGMAAALVTFASIATLPASAAREPGAAQANQQPGRSIGTISTRGDLIVLELQDGVLGRANMFDLEKRTLRFSPVAGGYQVETTALQWEAEPGVEMTAPQVTLRNFSFPFSGKSWDTFTV